MLPPLCQDFKKHENKNVFPLFCVLEVIMWVSYLNFMQVSEVELMLFKYLSYDFPTEKCNFSLTLFSLTCFHVVSLWVMKSVGWKKAVTRWGNIAKRKAVSQECAQLYSLDKSTILEDNFQAYVPELIQLENAGINQNNRNLIYNPIYKYSKSVWLIIFLWPNLHLKLLFFWQEALEQGNSWGERVACVVRCLTASS